MESKKSNRERGREMIKVALTKAKELTAVREQLSRLLQEREELKNLLKSNKVVVDILEEKYNEIEEGK